MRFAFLALAIAGTPALADTVAYRNNSVGGRIELHDAIATGGGPCHNKPIAKAWTGRTADILGCWTIDDSSVTILWFTSNGEEVRSYPIEGWITPKPKTAPSAPSGTKKHFNKET